MESMKLPSHIPRAASYISPGLPFFAEWNLEAVGFIQRLQFLLLCLHSRSYGSGPQAQL